MKYSVEIKENREYPIRITNNRTKQIKQYIPNNFIYNNGYFLKEVDKYPQYVHEQIWWLLDHAW